MKNNRVEKWLVVGIILLFLGTCIVPAIAQNIEKQSSRGTWLYVGGSGPGNYTRIQDAINDSNDGDTVFVFSGIYHEYIHVNKSIKLLGEEPTNTIIDGTNVHDAYYETIDIVSSNSVLNGFTVINIKNNKVKPWCVLIDANYVEIYGNIITGGSIGIQSGFGKGVHIFRNTITNNSIGCLLFYAELTEVSENNFIDNFQQVGFINCRSILWDGNYWDNTLLKVKVILGGYLFSGNPSLFIPFFNLDRHPAQEPYDIYGMS
jgi:nitrous oxidase accessory protein NosD